MNPECVSTFNDLKLKKTIKYIIYKISDDQKEVVVDETGTESDYDVFREKLIGKKEKNGKDRPSYAIYDVEFELGEGEGKRYNLPQLALHFIDADEIQKQACLLHLYQPGCNRCKGT